MKDASIATRISPILLAATVVTGVVDSVSFLALGHVFTANMTGNVVFLGFSFVGDSGLSIPRSLLSLFAFALGAVFGGYISQRGVSDRWTWVAQAFLFETCFLLVAAVASSGLSLRSKGHEVQVAIVIGGIAIAMGLRNAAVRKLAVPDLTTTVLTLTITGLAADAAPARGSNPRWQRRCGSVIAMFSGAAFGALLVQRSVALPLAVCVAASGLCALATFRIESRRG